MLYSDYILQLKSNKNRLAKLNHYGNSNTFNKIQNTIRAKPNNEKPNTKQKIITDGNGLVTENLMQMTRLFLFQ